MPRITQHSGSRLEKSSGISTDDLSGCTRERDFTLLSDLKHQHHHAFIRNIRKHVEYFFSWEDLRNSSRSRVKFAAGFLDIYGIEYWGLKNRGKYIMPDSVAHADEFRYPDDAEEITKTLVLLIKKKAENMFPKEEPETSEDANEHPGLGEVPSEHHDEGTRTRERSPSPSPSTTSRRSSKRLAENAQANKGSGKGGSDKVEADRVEKRRFNKLDRERRTPPSNPTSPSPNGPSVTKSLRQRYRRDTMFLLTTDRPATLRRKAAPIWSKYHTFTSASSFLLNMGPEVDIEGRGFATEADHISAANNVITEASLKFEWSGEEILVRWGNDGDWNFVMQMIQKASMARDFGVLVDVFKVKVVIHTEY
ncbi:hypothetical protein BJX70DRAFT_390916 [Aspergillus crustosus]